MNCYLVLARCGMDDIPMGVFAGHPEADDFANNVTKEDVANVAGGIFDLDTSFFVGVDVVEFRDGHPVAVHTVKGF